MITTDKQEITSEYCPSCGTDNKRENGEMRIKIRKLQRKKTKGAHNARPMLDYKTLGAIHRSATRP